MAQIEVNSDVATTKITAISKAGNDLVEAKISKVELKETNLASSKSSATIINSLASQVSSYVDTVTNDVTRLNATIADFVDSDDKVAENFDK